MKGAQPVANRPGIFLSFMDQPVLSGRKFDDCSEHPREVQGVFVTHSVSDFFDVEICGVAVNRQASGRRIW
jgi:hypothetical protein